MNIEHATSNVVCKIDKYIHENNMTFTTFCHLVKIDRMVIYSMKKGYDTRLNNFLKLCDFFNCTLTELIDDVPNNEHQNPTPKKIIKFR